MEFAQYEILFDKQSDCLRLTGNQEERSCQKLKLAPGEGDEDPYGWPCDDAGDGDGDGDDGDAYGYVPPKAERKGITKQKGKTTYSLLFVYI